MEGLVYRVLQEKAAGRLDVATTSRLLREVYSYRGVFDDRVAKPRETRRLLANYAVAFSRTAERLLAGGSVGPALWLFDKAQALISR